MYLQLNKKINSETTLGQQCERECKNRFTLSSPESMHYFSLSTKYQYFTTEWCDPSPPGLTWAEDRQARSEETWVRRRCPGARLWQHWRQASPRDTSPRTRTPSCRASEKYGGRTDVSKTRVCFRTSFKLLPRRAGIRRTKCWTCTKKLLALAFIGRVSRPIQVLPRHKCCLKVGDHSKTRDWTQGLITFLVLMCHWKTLITCQGYPIS